MGAVAAFIATTLTFSTTTFRALVYPEGGIVTSLSQGCSLLLSADDVAQTARPFFLLSAWQWPFVFVNKTLAGVAIGGGMFWLYGWPMMVRGVVTCSCVRRPGHFEVDPMTLLGLAFFLFRCSSSV